MTDESIIARTSAREYSRDAYRGTFVLTTERVLVIDLDGRTVRYEARRADIERATQDLRIVTIFRRNEVPGTSFALGSPLAGPVRWDWYLDRDVGRHAIGDRFWASANDPLVGPVDDARRAELAKWESLIGYTTVSPVDHYFDDLPREPVRWADIVEVVYSVAGEGDGPSWMLVVRLADGRWAYFDHVLQITGEVYTTTIVARSLDTLWWGALTEDQRDRLTAQMTRERLDEELVKLDSLLESGDPNVHEHAEQRMRQIARIRSL